MRDLRGKRVLITGAARGIGQALAYRFASEECRVIIADLPGAPLDDTASGVRARGGEAATVEMDVTDTASIAAAAAQIRERHGRIDVLVNNAGTVHGGAFLEVPLDRHLLTHRVNTLGPMFVTYEFLGDLIAQPEAHLVNIASASGFIGLPFGSSYASSKWALIGLGESLRLEMGVLGHDHVGVTTVCPSYTRTGLFDGAKPARTTRVLTPERLADQVVGAVRRNRPFVKTPWLVHLVPLLRGILPTRLFDLVGHAFGATTSMQDWRGRGSAAGSGGDEAG